MTFLKEILQAKEIEVANLANEKLREDQPPIFGFSDYLAEHADTLQLIAEVKRASPSKGAIHLTVDPVLQAQKYQAAGAAMISVLTDTTYFKGSMEDLQQVARVVQLPVLCKDFIISEKQLIRARNHGASVALLIVAALGEQRLQELLKIARQIGLETLVEVHDAVELEIAKRSGAELIGVNNRDLHSFKVDLAVSERLAANFSEGPFYISESGFREPADVERVKGAYQAVLVGEALMRAEDPVVAAKRLKVKR
ncbi:indole-3-glycerol phosphate synthase TrpC [Listeria costaricensis]|uniref:indole-3-glycerol phosphate synthase TrpC n=1 Tax=Listeria costaricensis TaxID=2026604 RepID=UPI000C06BFE1|nr:indole-3-glycerol phosphate synthase TrpC [Listeria costaricensis]